MKKTELKKVLKPLIVECVREAILEEGVLSGIVAEVARGVGTVSAPVQAAPAVDPDRERILKNAFSKQQTKSLHEHKKKLMDAIGGGAYNGVDLFEGTTPAPPQQTASQQATPMSGQAPNDPGVDISSLFGSVGTNWGAHMTKVKEEGK